MPILQWASQVTLVVKNLCAYAGDSRDSSLIPGSGRSPGEGNGNPHQYSWLENPIGRGARKATVHGVAKSWTRLMQLSILSEGKTLGSHSVLTYGETSLSIFCQISWIHCPYSLNIIIPFDMFPSGLIPMHLSGHDTLFPLKPSSLPEKLPGCKMLESTRPGFDPWLYCLIAVWPWTNCFTIPSLSSFSSNMGNKKNHQTDCAVTVLWYWIRKYM